MTYFYNYNYLNISYLNIYVFKKTLKMKKKINFRKIHFITFPCTKRNPIDCGSTTFIKMKTKKKCLS